MYTRNDSLKENSPTSLCIWWQTLIKESQPISDAFFHFFENLNLAEASANFPDKLDRWRHIRNRRGRLGTRLEQCVTRSSSSDYAQFCSLDVLGLEDRPACDQQVVCSEFQQQLVRHPEGWYETGPLWKAGHAPLPNNQKGSLARLSNLVKKLQ